MKRIDGYLDLNDLELTKELLDGDYQHTIYSFWLNKEKYYFKDGSPDSNIMSVLCSIIAKYLNIPSVFYDMATYKNIRGVISKDFNPNNYPYIYLADIIEKYFYEVIMNNKKLFPKENVSMDSNNLETIWWAIEYYYKDRADKREITQSLVNSIMNAFFLQIIIGNTDLHDNNLIILNADKPVLAPNFDFEKGGRVNYGVPCGHFCLKVFPLIRVEKYNPLIVLQNFIQYSDGSFIKELENKLDLLPNNNILLKDLETLIGSHAVSSEIKKYLLNGFKYNIDYLYKLLAAQNKSITNPFKL